VIRRAQLAVAGTAPLDIAITGQCTARHGSATSATTRRRPSRCGWPLPAWWSSAAPAAPAAHPGDSQPAAILCDSRSGHLLILHVKVHDHPGGRPPCPRRVPSRP
jgi:hypothetical protein